MPCLNTDLSQKEKEETQYYDNPIRYLENSNYPMCEYQQVKGAEDSSAEGRDGKMLAMRGKRHRGNKIRPACAQYALLRVSQAVGAILQEATRPKDPTDQGSCSVPRS